MLYIQKSVSENAGNCSHRGRKIQIEKYPRPPPPPTIKCDTTPNFLLPTNHLSFLHTRYSMVPFCRCPPPPTDDFLKNSLRYLYVTYMLKGSAVIGFNCCGVPAIRHLYNIVFVLYACHSCNFTWRS